MGWFRGLGRAAGAVLWVVVLLPVLALGPAAVLDRGPDGAPRATPFPAALVLLDPFTWLCLRNSLVVALVVTSGSIVLGVTAARLATGWRFWGRPLLAGLVATGLALPAAFGALGLRAWVDALHASTIHAPWPIAPGWLAWCWAALGPGAALVSLATAASLRGVDPVWSDAARLASARPGQVWRHLIGPLVRPDVARAAAAVFGLTLLDPGPPLVLGLRRTLGLQIAESALAFSAPGQAGRAVVLTLLGVAFIWTGRELLRLWGGAPVDAIDRPDPVQRPETAGWARGLLLGGLLGVPAMVAWLPVAGLVALARDVSALSDLFRDPLSRRYLMNSAWLAVTVVTLDLVLARLALALTSATRGRLAWLAAWPGGIPPLAVGIGALTLGPLLDLAAEALNPTAASAGVGLMAGLADALRTLGGWLDPVRTPGVLLVLGVAATRVAVVARSALERRHRLRPAPVDAAIALGARPGQARRTLSGRWLLGASPAAAVLTLALVATHPTPALILAPTAETRPLGPAVVNLAQADDHGRSRAAALALVGLAANLAALALAAPGRGGLARSWLRLA